MAIASFVAALAALLFGALFLNFASQGLEGRKTYFLHFGNVALVVVVGGALFPFWGWSSTGWVLGVAALFSMLPPLCGRLFGTSPAEGYVWHGDDPEAMDSETEQAH
jgi:hypothetical protein